MEIPFLPPGKAVFPPPETAATVPNGLLASGGELTADNVITAYKQSIFPWYEAHEDILWWTPDPRMVLFPDDLKLSRSMRKFMRKRPYTVTMDLDFDLIIKTCAHIRGYYAGIWITPAMYDVFSQLNNRGLAHSVEVWQGEKIVGGLYGLALGNIFYGESMFTRQTNASKVAMSFLVSQLKRWNFQLIDCQVANSHLVSLGAINISRNDFLAILHDGLSKPGKPGKWSLEIGWQDVIDEF